ncbi:Uncharacterised protein [Halioglobus japonicus]|nr:Uncharacterised protein [Halioglobus japonicus]
MDDTATDKLTLDEENPWPGMTAFSESNSAFFFGRSKEIDTLYNKVARNVLTVLFGKSGLGKSSILQAGLSPTLLQNQFVPVHIRLNHFEDTLPLEDQVEVFLEDTIKKYGIDAPKPIREETLWEYFHKIGNDWWSTNNELLKPVLIFDQFEEIITAGQENAVRAQRCAQFLEELEDLVENRPPEALLKRFSQEKGLAKNYSLDRIDYRIVITLREDYLADLESLRERLRTIMSNRVRILPLTENQALEVVLKPGKNIVDVNVAKELVNFVAGQSAANFVARDGTQNKYVEPALLCVILRELNNQRLAAGEEKISSQLIAKKQPEAIMFEFYKNGLEGLSREVRDFIEEQLLTASGSRNRVSEDDAIQRFKITEKDIATLVDRRIIQRERVGNSTWLELSHDTLTPVVKSFAETSVRRRKIKTRVARATIAAGFILVMLAGSLYVQLEIREQQTLEAAGLAVNLANQISESQTISTQVRQELTDTLERNLQNHIEKAPDSNLVRIKYIRFQLLLSEFFYDRQLYGEFEKVLEKAERSYKEIHPRKTPEAEITELSILFSLGSTKRAILREQFDLAERTIATAKTAIRNSGQRDTNIQYQILDLEFDYLFASILAHRYNMTDARSAYDLLENRISDTIESYSTRFKDSNIDIDKKTLSRTIRTLYQLLFSTIEGINSTADFVSTNKVELASRYRKFLDNAKPYFEAEHQPIWISFSANLDLMTAHKALKEHQVTSARSSYDSSVQKMVRLVKEYPDRISFQRRLMDSLHSRMDLTLERDEKQADEDLITIQKLAKSVLEQADHPNTYCRSVMYSGMMAMRFESIKDEPHIDKLYEEVQILADHCKNKLQLPLLTNNFNFWNHFYKVKAELESDNITESMQSIQETLAEIDKSIEIYAQNGASRDFLLNRKNTRYMTSSSFVESLEDVEALNYINEAIAVQESLDDQSFHRESGNYTWLLTNKSKLFERQGNTEEAINSYSDTVRFVLENFDENSKTLLTNAIWALSQQARLTLSEANITQLQELAEHTDLLNQRLRKIELAKKSEIRAGLDQFWKYFQNQFRLASNNTQPNGEEKLVIERIDTSINDFMTFITQTAQSSQSDFISVDLHSLTLPEVTKNEEGLYSSKYSVGWVTNSVYPLANSITVMGRDQKVNPHLRLPSLALQRARYSRLPFYAHCSYVVTEHLSQNGETIQRYVLENNQDEKLFQLDGKSDPIHKANKACGFDLTTIENAAAYLRFFGTFVHASAGAFKLVESIDELDWLEGATQSDKAPVQNLIRPVYLWKHDKSNNWHATGTVQYGDNLFYAKFIIQRDGMVSMDDALPIAENLLINSFSIALNSGRTSNFLNGIALPSLRKYSGEFDVTTYFPGFNQPGFSLQNFSHNEFLLASDIYKVRPDLPDRFNDYLELFSSWLASAKPQDTSDILQRRRESFIALSEHISEQSTVNYVSLSFYQLFSEQYEAALDSAQSAIAIDDTEYPAHMNMAHALMLLDRTVEAREIYERFNGQEIHTEDWGYYVNDDFDKLESVGITHPLMREVRGLLNTSTE